jgi:hypothetical protein
MEYTPVASSTIATVGYEPETMTLAIVFHSGMEYHYSSVPAEVAEGILTASSPGGYFDVYVKKAGYTCARVR